MAVAGGFLLGLGRVRMVWVLGQCFCIVVVARIIVFCGSRVLVFIVDFTVGSSIVNSVG